MDFFTLLVELCSSFDDLDSRSKETEEIEEDADVADEAYSYFEILKPRRIITPLKRSEPRKDDSLKSFFKKFSQKRLRKSKILRQMKKTHLEPILEVPEN